MECDIYTQACVCVKSNSTGALYEKQKVFVNTAEKLKPKNIYRLIDHLQFVLTI